MSAIKKSFLIALIYVILGTVYSQLYWTDFMAGTIVWTILYWFFIPVAFVPIMLIYVEREPFLSIVISQSVALLFIWALFFGCIKLFRWLRPKKG